VGGILLIPQDPAEINSDTNYLIDNYGMITLEEICRFEETYIDQPIRRAQDNCMMFKCLVNSISKEGKNKILIWKKQYHTVANFSSGNLLLKIIIRESYIRRKLRKYEEGESITSEELMQLGDNKYKLLKEGGLWNASSDEEEKILALQTEVRKLQKNMKSVPQKSDKTVKTDKAKIKSRTNRFEKP
jgi:hypothetical protein